MPFLFSRPLTKYTTGEEIYKNVDFFENISFCGEREREVYLFFGRKKKNEQNNQTKNKQKQSTKLCYYFDFEPRSIEEPKGYQVRCPCKYITTKDNLTKVNNDKWRSFFFLNKERKKKEQENSVLINKAKENNNNVWALYEDTVTIRHITVQLQASEKK